MRTIAPRRVAAARCRPRLGGGRAERLRQVQMADRARARGADRAGSRQAGFGQRTRGFAVDRHYAALVAPADAKLPTPPERAPKEGTFAGFASIKTAPKAGLYTISLSSGGWVDVVQDGHFLKPMAFSGATDCDGIRKTMKYELSASPFVLQISGTKEEFDLDRDPADRIGGSGRQTVTFTRPVSLLLFAARDIPIDRKSVGIRRNSASACRIPNPTNA